MQIFVDVLLLLDLDCPETFDALLFPMVVTFVRIDFGDAERKQR